MNVAAPPYSPPVEKPWIMRSSDQQDRRPDADRGVGREQADAERGAGHQQDRHGQYPLAADPVAERTPEDPAERADEERDREVTSAKQGRLVGVPGEERRGDVDRRRRRRCRSRTTRSRCRWPRRPRPFSVHRAVLRQSRWSSAEVDPGCPSGSPRVRDTLSDAVPGGRPQSRARSTSRGSGS